VDVGVMVAYLFVFQVLGVGAVIIYFLTPV